MGQKLHFFFKVTWGWVLKVFVLKKLTPFVLEFFKSDYLARKIWGKNHLFQDYIGLWVLKMLVSKE